MKIKPETQISDAILIFRAIQGLSQKKFAKKCGLSEQTICNIENKKQTPSKVTLIKIKKAMES